MTKDFFVITRPFLLAYLLKKKNGYLDNALHVYLRKCSSGDLLEG